MKKFDWNNDATREGNGDKVFAVLNGRKSLKDPEVLTICIKKDWIREYSSQSNNKMRILKNVLLENICNGPENINEFINISPVNYNISSYCGFSIKLNAEVSLLEYSKEILKEVWRNMDIIEAEKSYKPFVIKLEDDEWVEWADGK